MTNEQKLTPANAALTALEYGDLSSHEITEVNVNKNIATNKEKEIIIFQIQIVAQLPIDNNKN